MRDPGPPQGRIVLVGLSGVGKSALAARLRETLTQTRGECRILKLADPLYRIQRLYYEIACVEATGQDQALLATVATQLRALSPRALLDDFLDRLRQVPPDVAVVNDDLRDPDVDAVGLRAEGFVFVRVTCPEQVRRVRLAGRADISQIDELEWFGADLDRMEVDGTVDTSVHSVEECVQQVLRIAAEHPRPDGDAAHTVEDGEPMRLAHDQARVLVVGPWAWRFGRGPAPGDQYGVIRLPLGGAAVNTTLLRFAELVDAPYAALEWQGPVLVRGTLSCAPFADLRPAGELATTERAVSSDPRSTWVPLFIVGREGDEVVLHSQIRFGEPDALFLRTGTLAAVEVGDEAGVLQAAVSRAVEFNEANRTFLNNHQCYLRKFWPEDEIEYKLTLKGPVDIYDLTVEFRNAVSVGPLSGYLWEYRDDFQQWDFDNYLYEILGPEEEAGYISFIPDSLGTVVVKRKWFTEDAVRRRETRWRGVDVGEGGYDGYVEALGIDAVYRGSFRRTRFDVTYEAVDTGNVHSIMFDRCRPLDRDGHNLYQVEIEYLHSRSLDPGSSQYVESELKFLLDVAKNHLTTLGVGYSEGQLSKLSYLRGLGEQPASQGEK